MKSLAAILLLIGIFTLPLASLAQQDPAAGLLLDQLVEKYQSFTSYKADFSQALSNKEKNLDDLTSGTVVVKGGKSRIKVKGQELANDGEKVYVYLEEVNEISIDYYYPDEEGDFSPHTIAGLNKENFSYQSVGKENINGLPCDVIDLVPKDPNSGFLRIRLAISEDIILQESQMWDRANTQYKFTFSNLSVNLELEDSYFQLNDRTHPDAEVVDLTD